MSTLPITDTPPLDVEVDEQGETRVVTRGPVGVVPHDAKAVIDTMQQMTAIRTFVAKELKEKLDVISIPGVDKQVLSLAGSQKICTFFNVRPEFRVERLELPHPTVAGHVEYIVHCTLLSRVSGRAVSAGVGSCSTMESKYRYRKAERTCPECGKAAIIKGKAEYGGGWVCFKKKDGCGAKFRDGDQAIESQESGRIENVDIYDQRNTVLKMGKKRAYVDAAITMANLSEFFTQDLDELETFDLGIASKPEPKPETKTDAGAAAAAPNDSRLDHAESADPKRDNPPSSPPSSAKAAPDSTPASGKSTKAAKPKTGDEQQEAVIYPHSCSGKDRRWPRNKKAPDGPMCGFVYEENKTKWSVSGDASQWAMIEAATRAGLSMRVWFKRNGDFLNVSKFEVIE